MSLANYLAKRVCDLVRKSLGSASFGESIFEYDSHHPHNDIRVWGGAHVTFLKEGRLVKITLEENEMKEKVVQELRAKYGDPFVLRREEALFLEYVKPDGRDKTVVEAALTHEISEKEKTRFFTVFYKSAIGPTLGEILSLRKK